MEDRPKVPSPSSTGTPIATLDAKVTTVRMAQSKVRSAQEELSEAEASLVEAIMGHRDARWLLRPNYTRLSQLIRSHR